MATLKDIARECGVSVATVSNILNGKPKVSEATRERVLAVVERTGYRPNFFAQGMRKQKTNIIGIIAEDLNEFSTTPIVEAIMDYCENHGYRTILMNLRMYYKWGDTWYDDDAKLQEQLKPVISEMLSIKVDGIAYVAGHCRVVNAFPENFGVPGIVVYGLSKSPRFSSVVIDDERGGYEMTRYLCDRGHRRIGLICGEEGNIHTTKRLAGYKRALGEAGIPVCEELIRPGAWTRELAGMSADELMKAGVTAIFCMNDVMAGGVYDYLSEKGLEAGSDLSVVGYDNRIFAEYLKPKLTTDEIPFGAIGYQAARELVMTVDKEEPGNPRIIEIPCDIRVRDSVSELR